MIRDVTICNVFLQLVLQSQQSWDLFLNGEFLLVAQQKYCETSCKRDCYTVQWLKKYVAVLRQSLRKVEPDSTSCNASCNKNVAIVSHVTPCKFACNLCRNKLRNKLGLKTSRHANQLDFEKAINIVLFVQYRVKFSDYKNHPIVVNVRCDAYENIKSQLPGNS